MNPEFRRNLWLELNPRRMLLWGVMLGLVFAAAALTDGQNFSLIGPPASAARFLYYVLVVIWGARNAALSVVGEIRERTWDSQRLSSLGAGEMIWGKLFGATSFTWYQGAICLAVILVTDFAKQGLAAAAIDLVFYVLIGLIAQASALLTSLVAVRRRQNHTRGEIFLYQIAGIVAAIMAVGIWELADPAGTLVQGLKPTESIGWWGIDYAARGFLLVSLALFTGWILIGCWREMRVELKLPNGPGYWLGFLAFVCLYVAGFDGWLAAGMRATGADAIALRLGIAAAACTVLTYVMVLLEPKDRVHLRWLASQLAGGRIGKFVVGLQPFMMSYFATLLLSVALIWWRAHAGLREPGEIALLAAALGFITRDVALFLLAHAARGRQRGDITAVLILVALYGLIPAVVNALGAPDALVLFIPHKTDPAVISPLIAWAEALLVTGFAFARIALPERPAAKLAAA